MTPDRVVRWGMTIPVTGMSLADHAALVPALAAAGYTDIRTAEVAGTDAFYAARPRLDLGRLRAYVDAGIDTAPPPHRGAGDAPDAGHRERGGFRRYSVPAHRSKDGSGSRRPAG